MNYSLLERAEIAFERYQKKKEFLIQKNRKIWFIPAKKCIRPLLRLILFAQRKVMGFQVETMHYEKSRGDKPTIFVVTHIGKWDFEIVNEQILDHFHICAADFLNMYGRVSGLFMRVQGVIWVNEYSREDKHNTKEIMKKVLTQGDNIMIFPEGTWNLSENEIIYDIAYGTAEIAIQTDANIIPIAIEQYDKRFVINMGQTIQSEDYGKNKDVLIFALRDTLATLKWEIWEQHGVWHRTTVSESYWSDFIRERCSEWRGYSMKEQIVNRYIPKEKWEYWQVQEDLRTIDKIPLWYQMLLEEESVKNR